MEDLLVVNSTRLIIAALVGLGLLLFLIIKVKIHPLIAMLLGALAIGLIAGMPLEMIGSTVTKGVSNTLGNIALLIGLGSMFGAILEISGGAECVAITLLDRFGEKKSAWALGLTGMIIATPVFFEAGLITLIPLAMSIAKRTGKSTLSYGIPLLCGLAVGHAFIPPTPGPVLVAGILGVDLGIVIIMGIICGSVALVCAGLIFGKYAGDKYYISVPDDIGTQIKIDENKLPAFGTVVGIILIPLLLVVLSSVSSVVAALEPVRPVFTFLGTPFVAMLIAVLAAMAMLGIHHGYSTAELKKVLEKSLEPTGMVLLVVAGGGILRYMLEDSGLGDVIGGFMASSPLPMIVLVFLVAVCVRVAIGSTTVSATMAAGIVASTPEIANYSPMYLAACTLAICSGAAVLSHVNDSGFWLVKSMFKMDEKTTLKTWTVMETILGMTGFLTALVISFFC